VTEKLHGHFLLPVVEAIKEAIMHDKGSLQEANLSRMLDERRPVSQRMTGDNNKATLGNAGSGKR
jgi:hypothetical protein